MRDIRLARTQLFSGIGLFLVAGVAALVFLMPQWSKYQTLSRNDSSEVPAALQRLPVIYQSNDEGWRKNIQEPLHQASLETQVILVSAQRGNPAQINSGHLAGQVKALPVTLVINGSYASIQRFLAKLSERFPAVRIKSVDLKNTDPAGENPEVSPILESQITVDLFVLQQ